ncbi:FAD-dependent oxidoreductase [Streptomyces sp. NBC_01433]|uniref:FAD-dependent oxidoreductase n=1 Tax=Streptomyces sp. NBC_01433 TaxID=2903864 RepID=UPI00224F6550|nr:FAD-dependent oxidoreductase [Streptomyces sp. NBC_01433]MCX4674497.1 FAD-dependent oxidoreductase [Streptomyces sp. NBC_01433]
MRRTVAVIGGGYGGAAVAKALDEDTDVVLAEPKDAFVHAAGFLRALVRPDWAHNILFPYDKLLRRGRVIQERAVSVDPGGVTPASGARVDADYLVLATGSGCPYPAKTDTDVSGEALARVRATHKELADAERVLIVGAGPVGLELSGGIKAVWPDTRVTVIDPAGQLMPGFDPAMREELTAQLRELGVELRLSTSLTEEPPTGPGRAKTFTVGTTGGEGGAGDRAGHSADITADIWFRCCGVSVNSGYLADSLPSIRTSRGQVRVTERLNAEGYGHIYALGDLTDLDEAKMAGHAMKHAAVVTQNILAQVRGEEPVAVYRTSPVPPVLLPLGPKGRVGQVPTPDGPSVLSAEAVAEYKGADLLTGRFTELFGTG